MWFAMKTSINGAAEGEKEVVDGGGRRHIDQGVTKLTNNHVCAHLANLIVVHFAINSIVGGEISCLFLLCSFHNKQMR